MRGGAGMGRGRKLPFQRDIQPVGISIPEKSKALHTQRGPCGLQRLRPRVSTQRWCQRCVEMLPRLAGDVTDGPRARSTPGPF